MKSENDGKLLSIVIPAHNEAAGLDHAVGFIKDALTSSDMELEFVIVDDGSRDDTFARLTDLARADPRVKGVRLSRNFGKEAALLAGMNAAKGDAVVTMDADLQHPPQLIPTMIESWRSGAKVVDAIKRSREKDGIVARTRARLFNTLLSKLGGINLQNSSDFKLLDRTVVDAITCDLPERQRFYRGLSDWVGYRHTAIPFDVEARISGTGQWTIWKLMGLATTAIVSFTSAPLRIVMILGFTTLLLGFLIAADAIISWFLGYAVSGFATIIVTLLILGSFIMISLGIIGEYIAKIYDEIKHRPAYLIESSVGIDENDRTKAP